MDQKNELQVRIYSHADEFSKSDKTIAKFITNNIDRISENGIDLISEELNISKSTISRFCQKIGFSGFSELKYFLSSEQSYKNEEVKQSDGLLTFDIKSFRRALTENGNIYIFTKTINNWFVDMFIHELQDKYNVEVKIITNFTNFKKYKKSSIHLLFDYDEDQEIKNIVKKSNDLCIEWYLFSTQNVDCETDNCILLNQYYTKSSLKENIDNLNTLYKIFN